MTEIRLLYSRLIRVKPGQTGTVCTGLICCTSTLSSCCRGQTGLRACKQSESRKVKDFFISFALRFFLMPEQFAKLHSTKTCDLFYWAIYLQPGKMTKRKQKPPSNGF